MRGEKHSPLKFAILSCRCDNFTSVVVLRERANSRPDDISGGMGSCSAAFHQKSSVKNHSVVAMGKPLHKRLKFGVYRNLLE